MTSSAETDRVEPTDDVLPPVQPPSAGFILQLFIVPGLIVTIIVMVWLMINWLAVKTTDPDVYIKRLKSANAARWQAAHGLATLLADEGATGPDSVRGNAGVARELAAILQHEMDEGSSQTDAVTLRYWLCKAIGAFEVPDGLPTLLRAAATQRAEEETDVRRAALEAVGKLAEHSRRGVPLEHPELAATLQACAGDDSAPVREAAAYALGAVGQAPMLERLVAMLDDTSPNVRYNAATGLARHGRPECAAVLVEMLDPREQVGVAGEKDAQARVVTREVIFLNGMSAAYLLAEKNAAADVRPVMRQLEKLLLSDASRPIRVQARDTLAHLKRLRPQDAAGAERE